MALGKGGGEDLPLPSPAPKPVKSYGNIADLVKVTSPVPALAPPLAPAPMLPKPIQSPGGAEPMPIKAYTSLKAARALNIPIPPPAHPVTTPAAHAILTTQAVAPKRIVVSHIKAMSTIEKGIQQADASELVAMWQKAHAATAETGDPQHLADAAAYETATGTPPDGAKPAAGMAVDSQGNPVPPSKAGEDSEGGIATVSQEEIFHYYVKFYGAVAKQLGA